MGTESVATRINQVAADICGTAAIVRNFVESDDHQVASQAAAVDTLLCHLNAVLGDIAIQAAAEAI